MAISAKDVGELRKKTGAGMMDAKKALDEVGGDMEKAIAYLREKGLAKAAKKSDRETNEGRVHAYIHSNGKIGALVEVLCETDFVARNEDFIEFCNDLGMHVVAAMPEYLTREEVPQEKIDAEKAIYQKEMEGQGKPEDVIEKIVEGKLNKFFADVVLMEQSFVKDDEKTVEEFIKGAIVTLGENIQLRRFTRFELGA